MRLSRRDVVPLYDSTRIAILGSGSALVKTPLRRWDRRKKAGAICAGLSVGVKQSDYGVPLGISRAPESCEAIRA